MLLALTIFFGTAMIAAAIAKFLLHLTFRSTPVDLENDSGTCHENWAAHRACPQSFASLSGCVLGSRDRQKMLRVGANYWNREEICRLPKR
jgi:hypothetical protein